MNQSALIVLNKYKNIVWPEIKRYLVDPSFPKEFEIDRRFAGLIKYHWKIVSEYPKRKGKYLRPTLLILTAQAMGADKKKSIKTAAAMQVSEEWILIHDDIQDNSPLRRGKPSLHKIFGNELAINAGDTLHSVMWKIIGDNMDLLGSKKTSDLIAEFHRIITRTTLGQTVDIKWFSEKKESISNNEYFLTSDSKSGYYSIAAPMRLGAIIANATNEQLESISKYGKYLGRAFQLTDDLLDVTSDFNGLKQFGNDIYEGKKTLILGHLLRSISGNTKNKVLDIVGRPRNKKTTTEVNWVIDMMKKHKSTKYARDMATKYKMHADLIFETNLKFIKLQPFRNQLQKIADFVIERDH